MNSTCRDAYTIFCDHNKGKNYKQVEYMLNVLNTYKKKPTVSNCELDFLLHYIKITVGPILLSEYEKNILIMAISELKIHDLEGNKEILTYIFFCINKIIKL